MQETLSWLVSLAHLAARVLTISVNNIAWHPEHAIVAQATQQTMYVRRSCWAENIDCAAGLIFKSLTEMHTLSTWTLGTSSTNRKWYDDDHVPSQFAHDLAYLHAAGVLSASNLSSIQSWVHVQVRQLPAGSNAAMLCHDSWHAVHVKPIRLCVMLSNLRKCLAAIIYISASSQRTCSFVDHISRRCTCIHRFTTCTSRAILG